MGTAYSIDSLAAAIAREENVNPSYNNPGAIMSGGVLEQFPTLAEGQSALTNLLNKAVSGQSQYYNPNESIEQFEQTYTGGDTNAGSNVASILGVPSSTPISSFGTNVSAPTNPATTAAQPSTFQQFLAALNDQFGPSIFGKTIGPSLSNPDGTFSIPSVMDITVIIVGIVLLAGAVFGFRSLTNTVVEGAKHGAELTA